MPPHTTSPRGNTAKISSFTLGPADDPTSAGWLHCLSGGNKLPLPVRLQAAAAEPKLNGYTACARQLIANLTQVTSQDLSAFEGLPAVCAIVEQAIGAEAVAVLPAATLGLEMCLGEHNFTDACHLTLDAAPPCERLVSSLSREIRAAAESRGSLNLGGDGGAALGSIGGGPRGGGGGGGGIPAALEAGQVAVREPRSVGGSMIHMQPPPLHSALVFPVADPHTGGTVAMLICCNAKAGRFDVHDELFAEAAALQCGLVWLHHLRLLRLQPLPGAPLAPPDVAAATLKLQWGALGESRLQHRTRRQEAAHALANVGGVGAERSPHEALALSCRRVLLGRAVELREAMQAVTQPWRRAQVELLEKLTEIGEQWASATLIELKGECTRLGGAAAADTLNELLVYTVQAMTELSAHFHANSLSSGAMMGKAPAESRSMMASGEAVLARAPEDAADTEAGSGAGGGGGWGGWGGGRMDRAGAGACGRGVRPCN